MENETIYRRWWCWIKQHLEVAGKAHQHGKVDLKAAVKINDQTRGRAFCCQALVIMDAGTKVKGQKTEQLFTSITSE